MSFWGRFRKIDRRYFHVCYTCMMQTDHDAVKSIFYSEGPPVLILERPWMQCPRCGGTNTKSFQQLKEEGSESALWGLERTVRKNPRELFYVKAAPAVETSVR
jgi:hypothetical protein